LQLDPVSRERKLGWRARGLPYCRSAGACSSPPACYVYSCRSRRTLTGETGCWLSRCSIWCLMNR
jgi:hypothetical protein